MTIDKNKIKQELSNEQIFQLLTELGGNPTYRNDIIISDTICHNLPGEGSHKLYYYPNQGEGGLFHCYTECNDSFDIFELIIKVKKLHGEQWTLYNAISYILNYFGIAYEGYIENQNAAAALKDWSVLSKYEKNSSSKEERIVDLKFFDNSIIKNMPRPHILNWEREGITKKICDARNICYNPADQGIIIPHYNIDGKLIGIRERTLNKDEEKFGKYRPVILNGIMYNHPLGFNLYNLNYSKDNIKKMKTAIVFEAEKSCLQYASFFGVENDITVACCGSNLLNYQFSLLYKLGITELIIAFDRQYKDANKHDKEWIGWTKKLMDLYYKYNKYVKISFIFDKQHILKYKDSPTDEGADTFLYLFKHRITI